MSLNPRTMILFFLYFSTISCSDLPNKSWCACLPVISNNHLNAFISAKYTPKVVSPGPNIFWGRWKSNKIPLTLGLHIHLSQAMPLKAHMSILWNLLQPLSALLQESLTHYDHFSGENLKIYSNLEIILHKWSVNNPVPRLFRLFWLDDMVSVVEAGQSM